MALLHLWCRFRPSYLPTSLPTSLSVEEDEDGGGLRRHHGEVRDADHGARRPPRQRPLHMRAPQEGDSGERAVMYGLFHENFKR